MTAFRDWLATQPADEAYDYVNPSTCAYAMYQRATGTFEGSLLSSQLPVDLRAPLQAKPWTYGALLERLS